MEFLKKILDGFVKAVSVLLMLLVASIVLLMLNELFLRNVLNKSFRGMTELAGFLFLWMAFLGIVVLYDKHRLISLDMLYVRSREPLSTVLWFVHNVVSLSLGAIMIVSFVGLYPYVSTEYYSSMPTFAKMWQYLPMPIAGGFLCIKSVSEIIEKIRMLCHAGAAVAEVTK
jgi:TRAP-type C4-dicarboxylate transport system permease small subunit